MNSLDEIYKVLPLKISDEIKKHSVIDLLQEIRVKIDRPIILNCNDGEIILDYCATREDLKNMISKISNYS